MERAFRVAGKDGVYDYRDPLPPDLPKATPEKPIVYKLHGSAEPADKISGMLCTEDDVLDFITRAAERTVPLPQDIKILFTSFNSFLFIGYSLRDWNIRWMLRSMKYYTPAARSKVLCSAAKTRLYGGYRF
jgi:hypothetical protein